MTAVTTYDWLEHATEAEGFPTEWSGALSSADCPAATPEKQAAPLPAAAVCDPVDQASEDSFPASDPPSWIPVRL